MTETADHVLAVIGLTLVAAGTLSAAYRGEPSTAAFGAAAFVMFALGYRLAFR